MAEYKYRVHFAKANLGRDTIMVCGKTAWQVMEWTNDAARATCPACSKWLVSVIGRAFMRKQGRIGE